MALTVTKSADVVSQAYTSPTETLLVAEKNIKTACNTFRLAGRFTGTTSAGIKNVVSVSYVNKQGRLVCTAESFAAPTFKDTGVVTVASLASGASALNVILTS